MIPDCYDYVRRYYQVPAYVGVRVKLSDGKEGVIVFTVRRMTALSFIATDSLRVSGCRLESAAIGSTTQLGLNAITAPDNGKE